MSEELADFRFGFPPFSQSSQPRQDGKSRSCSGFVNPGILGKSWVTDRDTICSQRYNRPVMSLLEKGPCSLLAISSSDSRKASALGFPLGHSRGRRAVAGRRGRAADAGRGARGDVARRWRCWQRVDAIGRGDCRRGAVSPAALAARVLRRGLSADAPFPPHGRAAAGIVPEGLCQRHRDHQRRQRGDGGGHDDAAAARPRRGLALAPRFRRPSAAGGHAVPVVLPVHGQCREPHARPRGQCPSRRRRPPGGCR